MQEKKLLILCQNQWGYLLDTYKYATLLQCDFNVTYLCWDYGHEKIDTDTIKVKYVSRNGSLLSRNARYLSAVFREIYTSTYNVCFIKYFRGCSLLRMLFRKLPFVFDIRSAAVGKGTVRRFIYDRLMIMESRFFHHVSVISYSLACRLGIEKKSFILPLGSDVISNTTNVIDTIRLIYVGTLSRRDVLKTIDGFYAYLHSKNSETDAIYTIVGDGLDMDLLKEKVYELGLENNVKLLGYIPFSKLGTLMESHNIGVSFVPMTEYFECQPVTKTFDYLLSGMPVIATATFENKAVIKPSNGICINDNSEAFCNGIADIYTQKNMYDSNDIRESARIYEWKYIASTLKKYLYACSI